jgi:hypothetical protein
MARIRGCCSHLSPQTTLTGRSRNCLASLQQLFPLLFYSIPHLPLSAARPHDAVATLPSRCICGARHSMLLPTQRAPLRQQHATRRVHRKRDRREPRCDHQKQRMAHHHRSTKEKPTGMSGPYRALTGLRKSRSRTALLRRRTATH